MTNIKNIPAVSEEMSPQYNFVERYSSEESDGGLKTNGDGPYGLENERKVEEAKDSPSFGELSFHFHGVRQQKSLIRAM